MKRVCFLILIVVALWCLVTTKDPENLKILKEKYRNFLRVLPKEYEELKHGTVITGLAPFWGELGYNINKGYEICICMDNDVNAMFHVLIHEMAHSITDAYKHDDEFWNNYSKLRDHAIQAGLYKPIGTTQFCGKKISD